MLIGSGPHKVRPRKGRDSDDNPESSDVGTATTVANRAALARQVLRTAFDSTWVDHVAVSI